MIRCSVIGQLWQRLYIDGSEAALSWDRRVIPPLPLSACVRDAPNALDDWIDGLGDCFLETLEIDTDWASLQRLSDALKAALLKEPL
jgi:hypothetical protein